MVRSLEWANMMGRCSVKERRLVYEKKKKKKKRRRRRSEYQTDRYEKLKNSHAIHLPRAFYTSALLPLGRSLLIDVGEPFHSQFGQVMEGKGGKRKSENN